MPRTVSIDKHELSVLLTSSRDSFIISCLATYAEGWQDGSVTDLQKYRRYLLGVARGYHEKWCALYAKEYPFDVEVKRIARVLQNPKTPFRSAYTMGHKIMWPTDLVERAAHIR